jgi:hypothetical protein
MWNNYDQQALTQFQHDLAAQQYSQWPVALYYQQGTQALAEALRQISGHYTAEAIEPRSAEIHLRDRGVMVLPGMPLSWLRTA